MVVSNVLFGGRTKSGKWVYGYFVKLNDYLNESQERFFIIPEGSIIYPKGEICELIEVDPETVSQWNMSKLCISPGIPKPLEDDDLK